jgi:hypothetical protein
VCADGKTRTLDVFTDADVLAAEQHTRHHDPGWGRIVRRILDAHAQVSAEERREAGLARPAPGLTPEENAAVKDRIALLNGK